MANSKHVTLETLDITLAIMGLLLMEFVFCE